MRGMPAEAIAPTRHRNLETTAVQATLHASGPTDSKPTIFLVPWTRFREARRMHVQLLTHRCLIPGPQLHLWLQQLLHHALATIEC